MKVMFQAMRDSLVEMILGTPPVINREGQMEEVVVDQNEEVDSKVQDDDLGLDYPVLTLPMKSPQVLRAFLAKNEDIVNEYAFKCLKMAVIRNLPEVVLFRLGDSDFLAMFEFENYPEQLDRLADYFVKTEQYEKASECKKLKDRCFIERLIGESLDY